MPPAASPWAWSSSRATARRMRSTEDWSREDPSRPGQDRRQLVLEKIQNALDWWNAQSPDGSLELFLPAAGAYGAPQTLGTGYEPIRMDVDVRLGRPPRRALRRRLALAGHGPARLRPRCERRPALPRDAVRRQASPPQRRGLGLRRLRGRQPQGRRRHVPQRRGRVHRRPLRPVHRAQLRQRRLWLRQLRRRLRARDGSRVRGARRVCPAERRVSEHRRPDLRLPRGAQQQRRAGWYDRPPLHHARLRRDAGFLCPWRPVPAHGRADRPARYRRRHPPGRGRHPARVRDADGDDGRERLGDPAGHRDRAAAPPWAHQHGRLLPPRPEHQGAARAAVPDRRRRLAAADGDRRRVRRAVRGLDADHRGPDRGSPRARSRGDDG